MQTGEFITIPKGTPGPIYNVTDKFKYNQVNIYFMNNTLYNNYSQIHGRLEQETDLIYIKEKSLNIMTMLMIQ